MRILANIKLTIPLTVRDRGAPDSAYQFWNNFVKYLTEGDEDEDRPKRRPIRAEDMVAQHEARLVSIFPKQLERELRDHMADATVIYKGHSYGSLNVAVEVISGTVSSLGFTTSDVLGLLQRYSSEALTDISSGMRYLGRDFQVDVTGKEIDEPPSPVKTNEAPLAPAATTSGSRVSRGDAVWWIANTSLVIPALLLVAGAYAFFDAMQGERASLTEALLQERSAIAAERQKLSDGYENRLKAVEAIVVGQSQYIREIYALEVDLLKARLAQSNAQPSNP